MGNEKGSCNCFNEAIGCELPKSMTTKYHQKMSTLLHRLQASAYICSKDYKYAREFIDKLFNFPQGGSLQDLALRAALEIHCAVDAGDDLICVVKHYKSAIIDLEAFISLDPDPAVVKACLKVVKKKLFTVESVLSKEELASTTLNTHGTSELDSVVVRVDLAPDFGSKHNPVSASLSYLADELHIDFLDKSITVNNLERGPSSSSISPFLIYKVLQASANVGLSKRFNGVFTSRTNMTLIPGKEILARSQNSLLYAISCHGTTGQVWAKRLDKGICFGGTVQWLKETLRGSGQNYFDQLDKAVRHIWDDDVIELFKKFMIYQFSPQRRLKFWHRDTGLNYLHASVLVSDKDLLTKYLEQLSHHTIGILCTGGDKNHSHAVAAVINPKDANSQTGVFSRFYDFNNEEGDVIVKNVSDLAEHFSLAFTPLNGPITLQLYSLETANLPLLHSESH